MTYLKTVLNKKQTPQSQPIPGSAQVANSAGGYTFAVDDWTRLARFLVLGAEGGSYYAGERALTLENAEAVKRCIARRRAARGAGDRRRVRGRARAEERPGPVRAGDVRGVWRTRTRAGARRWRPCRRWRGSGRTCSTSRSMWTGCAAGGAGCVRRSATGTPRCPPTSWPTRRSSTGSGTAGATATCCACRTRSRRRSSISRLYHWLTQGWEGVGETPHPDAALRLVWAAERAKTAGTAAEVAALIREYRLPREAVPTQWLTDPFVWEALLEEMPMTALIRNLATLTRVGLLTPQGPETRQVAAQITDEARLRKARVHPIRCCPR